MTDENFTPNDRKIAEVLRRIDLLKSPERISLEEKVKIAELVLSILEEERTQAIAQ